MDHLLDNPVFHALHSGDQHLGSGNENLRYFDAEVSPFVAFPEGYEKGFEELHELLPEGRYVLYASRQQIAIPHGWQLVRFVAGLQFIYRRELLAPGASITTIALGSDHVPAMVALASLTKPGPFNNRTIEFGHYHGVFEDDKLVAMTGQRLHPGHYTEISAVCTHPNYLGRGYAAALLQQQMRIICGQGQIPFLHVRDDNQRAITLYERLGFEQNGSMNFYFLRKSST